LGALFFGPFFKFNLAGKKLLFIFIASRNITFSFKQCFKSSLKDEKGKIIIVWAGTQD